MDTSKILSLLPSDELKMLSLLPIWLSAIIVCGVIYSYFRSWYRLRDFKGPWLAGLSEAWLFGVTTTGALHMRLYDVNKKYGAFHDAQTPLPFSSRGLRIRR